MPGDQPCRATGIENDGDWRLGERTPAVGRRFASRLGDASRQALVPKTTPSQGPAFVLRAEREEALCVASVTQTRSA
jgi:hypothetical protein